MIVASDVETLLQSSVENEEFRMTKRNNVNLLANSRGLFNNSFNVESGLVRDEINFRSHIFWR